MEFLRGNYTMKSLDMLIYLLLTMSPAERSVLRTIDHADQYRELWCSVFPSYPGRFSKPDYLFGMERFRDILVSHFVTTDDDDDDNKNKDHDGGHDGGHDDQGGHDGGDKGQKKEKYPPLSSLSLEGLTEPSLGVDAHSHIWIRHSESPVPRHFHQYTRIHPAPSEHTCTHPKDPSVVTPPSSTVMTWYDLLDQIPIVYHEQEWGFPKGRKYTHESEWECAKREWTEETGLSSDWLIPYLDYSIINEKYVGSNGIHYQTRYFVCQLDTHSLPPATFHHQEVVACSPEISSRQWVSMTQAVTMFRSYHVTKFSILGFLQKVLETEWPHPVQSNDGAGQHDDDDDNDDDDESSTETFIVDDDDTPAEETNQHLEEFLNATHGHTGHHTGHTGHHTGHMGHRTGHHTGHMGHRTGRSSTGGGGPKRRSTTMSSSSDTSSSSSDTSSSSSDTSSSWRLRSHSNPIIVRSSYKYRSISPPLDDDEDWRRLPLSKSI